MVCFSSYILADTFFIANALGSNGLAALNFSIPIFSLLQGFGLMIGIGGATKYTILKSKGEDHEANSIFTLSLIAGFFIAVFFVAIGVFFTTPLAKMLGADADTLPLAAPYIQTVLYFSPFFMLSSILTAFIRNDDNPKLAMSAMVTGSLSNIVLDYIFLFPLSMGMFGAALATGLSLVLGVCVLSLHFWKKKNKFGLYKCKIQIWKIMDFSLLGSSALISELSFAIVLIAFNLVILKIEGNIGVAAYGIVANIAFVALLIFTGVAQGIQPLISKGYGTSDNVLVEQILKYAIALVLLLAFAIYGILNLYSTVIVAAFNSEADTTLALLAANGIRVHFIGLIFAGVNIVAAAFFSAIANAKTALIIATLRSGVLIIPAVIILSTILKMDGVWISFVLTELIVSVLSIIFFIKNSIYIEQLN